jgi:hypothetical protein
MMAKVMKECRVIDSINIVLIKIFVDNVKIVSKDRAMFEEIVVDLIYVLS